MRDDYASPQAKAAESEREEGAAEERAAIVAYLRRRASCFRPETNSHAVLLAEAYAVERGEHHL